MFYKLKNIKEFHQYSQCYNSLAINKKDIKNNTNSTFEIKGFSYPAKQYVNFKVNSEPNSAINWRETVFCPITNLSTRKRIIVHVTQEIVIPHVDTIIYISEKSDLSEFFLLNYKNLIYSEYLGNDFISGTKYNGIQHEDFTCLSFPNRSLDIIIHSDVFEHIPNFIEAFKECYRTLKQGGTMLWTVPFIAQNENNRIRAIMKPDGCIEHLMKPEYHGDPNNPDGILCFTHFGWEMLNQVRDVGFSEAYALATYSSEFGYLAGHNLSFIAIK